MFPVVLDMDSRKVVVFGGGEVAVRRVAKLHGAGAVVKVVSRDFQSSIMEIGDVETVKADITPDNVSSYLKGAFMAVAATDDLELNAFIEKECRKVGVLCNRADAPSDVIFPAVINEGDITIAVSTSGRSPAVAKAIKKRIKNVLTSEDLASLELQEYLRAMLKNTDFKQKERESILRDVLNMPEIIDLLKKGDLARAKKAARRLVDAHH